ncbi:hypothetical protein I552_5157 [Mycobacterium xenopi 3993]|nr:hypothetical protein I552_5157 [Mycobacterium xenopi 3993]
MLGQSLRDSQPDPPRSAGDDRRAAGEIFSNHVRCSSSSLRSASSTARLSVIS